MTAATTAVAVGDTSGRPGRPDDQERGEHSAESVLSWATGAGPKELKEDCVVFTCRPDRPVRFNDPIRNAAYWARIDAIVDSAPPLSDEQRAVIRTAFLQPAASWEAA